jgi:hypothetical protein
MWKSEEKEIVSAPISFPRLDTVTLAELRQRNEALVNPRSCNYEGEQYGADCSYDSSSLSFAALSSRDREMVQIIRHPDYPREPGRAGGFLLLERSRSEIFPPGG